MSIIDMILLYLVSCIVPSIFPLFPFINLSSAPMSALYRRKDDSSSLPPTSSSSSSAPRHEHTSIDFGLDQSQSLLQSPQEDTYADARHAEIRSIESTIQQLGGIFQQLADLVAQQGEQIQRYGLGK